RTSDDSSDADGDGDDDDDAADWRAAYERRCAAETARDRRLPPSVHDIEADSPDFHHYEADYGPIYQRHLRQHELKYRARPYMPEPQHDLKASYRTILVDWIVEVCEEYRLSWTTLFLVVELIDRSLSRFRVQHPRLQLLGCACILLAAKYEEIYTPSVNDLVYISDNTYAREDMLAMERRVAAALGFRLTCVTPASFAARFCAAARSMPREASLVRYLLALALQDYGLVGQLASVKAAAALHLARQTLPDATRPIWDAQIAHYTGYAPGDAALQRCVRRMHALHLAAEEAPQKAVRAKFNTPENHRVTCVTCLLPEQLSFDP
ncbi:unnamed protein product, partial [Phaeothamnion confervicola]